MGTGDATVRLSLLLRLEAAVAVFAERLCELELKVPTPWDLKVGIRGECGREQSWRVKRLWRVGNRDSGDRIGCIPSDAARNAKNGSMPAVVQAVRAVSAVLPKSLLSRPVQTSKQTKPPARPRCIRTPRAPPRASHRRENSCSAHRPAGLAPAPAFTTPFLLLVLPPQLVPVNEPRPPSACRGTRLRPASMPTAPGASTWLL